MGRNLKHDPTYSGKFIRLPMDFYEVLSKRTEWIPEDQWRIHIPGYYERCLAIAKANPLIIFDLDMDIVS